ncbi:MAG: hypothetical protein H7Z41_19470 [Cytophagales bacterium]|nr:hypothetical protein [Armatimonadota bacterium]
MAIKDTLRRTARCMRLAALGLLVLMGCSPLPPHSNGARSLGARSPGNISVASLPVEGKGEAAFGRFGRIHEDGLLTLNVSPEGFETPLGGKLRVRWGDGRTPITSTVVHLDPTEKRLSLSGGGDGAPTMVRYSLLYPGFSATFGRRLVLRAAAESSEPEPVVSARVGFAGADGLWYESLVLRRGQGSPGVAVLMRLSETATFRSAKEGGQSVTIIEDTQPIGVVRFVTPLGIRSIVHAEDERLWQAMKSWAVVPIPSRLSSASSLSADGKSVTITETFTGKVAPLPPILAFAMRHGYPATVAGKIVYTDAVTKYGPFAVVAGNTLRYTLPVPPTEERGYVPIQGQDPRRVALLNELVGHLGGAWASNAVDLGYAGMANAQMAGPYLSPARRKEVAAAWRAYLPSAFALPPYADGSKQTPWKVATEPFTSQSYLWNYCIDGPGGYRYDLEWGNALPLYGLYKYAQYSGDWQMVRRHWADVQRIYRYFDLGDDWAWMTVVNADHGYSTGTGDPLCAAYAAHIACLKMARVLGDRESEKRFAVRAARCAVATVSRFGYTDWGREQGLLGPRSVALGYQEAEGFTRSNTDDGPWYVSTLLSGDGALPELFTLYRAYGKDALRRYEARYAADLPRWYQGSQPYPKKVTYDGNSIYVAFPHVFARAAVLDEPTTSLVRYLDGIQTNRNNAWIGPNVVAEVLSRHRGGRVPLFLLTEWEPAAYREGAASPDGRQVTLQFVLPKPALKTWRFAARLDPRFAPASVRAGGRPIPFRFTGDVLTVPLARPTPGGLKIDVRLKGR